MRLTPTQIEKISKLLIEGLKKEHILKFKVDEHKVVDKVCHIILRNMEEEAELDKEVEQLINEHSTEMDAESMDYRKMFGMIKNKLAKERDIVI